MFIIPLGENILKLPVTFVIPTNLSSPYRIYPTSILGFFEDFLFFPYFGSEDCLHGESYSVVFIIIIISVHIKKYFPHNEQGLA